MMGNSSEGGTSNSALLQQLLSALLGSQSGGFTGGQGGRPGLNIDHLLRDLVSGSGAPAPDLRPAWAKEMPADTTQLLRQLSGNVGQMTMPGGLSGAVKIPAFGSQQQATTQFDPLTYGQQGGEATFFAQAMNGGMTPISAISPLGVPQGWNPFNLPKTSTTGKPGDKKNKEG